MPVIYDSKKVIPGPFATIQRNIERGYDGRFLRQSYQIILSGTISAARGSPNHQGQLWTDSGYPPDTPFEDLAANKRLAIMRNKMGALERLFNTEGKWLEIQPFDGSAPIKCQPRLTNIVFDEGNWVDKVPYKVTFDADCLYYGDVAICASDAEEVEESWSLEQADDEGRTFRLSHQVSAQRKRKFASNGSVEQEGWQVARDLVLAHLGLDNSAMQAAGVLNLSGHQAYNYARSQEIVEHDGRCSVTETWLVFDPTDNFGDAVAGACVEELQVEARQSEDQDRTKRWSVTVQGTIRGLEERNNTTRELIRSRWDNAQLRFAQITEEIAHARAQSYSGITVNPVSRGRSIGENPKSGVITYTWEFDDRPDETDDAVVGISIDHPADVFAAIGVLNRPAGPVLQALGSKTQKSITISADIIKEVRYGQPEIPKPTFNPVPTALSYMGAYQQVFVASDRENWVPRRGTYNRTTTFVYQ